MPNRRLHVVKLDADLYEKIKKQGRYQETFSDILKRLLNF